MTRNEIIDQFNEVYEGAPWYGNSVSTYLQSVKPEHLSIKIGNGHSIGQIIAHMITWRKFVIRKLEGDPTNIEVGGPEDWEDHLFTAADKTRLYTEFKVTQKILNDQLNQVDEEFLKKQVPGKAFNYETLLVGIIQHDIYHLGQIYLLKASANSK